MKSATTTKSVLVTVTFLTFASLYGCDKPAKVVSQPSAAKPARMSRDQAKSVLLGRTKAEVISAIGRPKSTASASFGDVWFYNGISFDEAAGTVDRGATIAFTPDRVGQIDFN